MRQDQAMERRKETFEVLLELTSPMAHMKGTEGNFGVAMSQTLVDGDGRDVRIPIITGNSLRHALREISADIALRLAGIEGGLEESGLRLLFNGGVMRDSGTKVRIADYRKMVELMPIMALFGGATDNRLWPGQIEVGIARLVCRETERWLPRGENGSPNGWVHQALEERSMSGLLRMPAANAFGEAQHFQYEPNLNPSRRRLLSAGANERIEQKLIGREAANDEDDDSEKLKHKLAPRPFAFEVIKPGCMFYWKIDVVTWSPLEQDAFIVALYAFLSEPRAGGKNGIGYGQLSAFAGSRNDLTDMVESLREARGKSAQQLTFTGHKHGELYARHVADRAAEIREWLGVVRS